MSDLVTASHTARWEPIYAATLIPDDAIPWHRLGPVGRRRLITGLWLVVTAPMAIGWYEPRAYLAVVAASAFQAVLFLLMFRGRALVFPVQLRIAYLAWVAVGSLVPGMLWMMWVATAGAVALFAADYCPMARTLYLLPWNRRHPMTPTLAWRTFATPPRPGRFRL